MSDAGAGVPELRAPGETLAAGAGRELFVRHVRKDGRSVAILRAVDHGSSCIVEADVFPAGQTEAVRPGPYTFADAREATSFVTEAVETLMYLGCDVSAS